MDGKFVSYLRVSTASQGATGLGIDAQRAAVAVYLNGGSWTLLGEYVEVESGKRSDRPQLDAALKLCQITGATLVVAKLDRLSRDAHFLLGLQKASVDFLAVDLPNANKLTVGVMALVAQQEREAISARTKAALAAARARGTVLGGYRGGPAPDATLGASANRAKADGFAEALASRVMPLRAAGLSLRGIAAALTEQGVRTARGGQWTAAAVRNLLARQTPPAAPAGPDTAIDAGSGTVPRKGTAHRPQRPSQGRARPGSRTRSSDRARRWSGAR